MLCIYYFGHYILTEANLDTMVQESLRTVLDVVVISAGPFEVKLAAVAIHVGTRKLDLTEKEAGLLAFLLSRPNEYISIAEMRSGLWQQYSATTKTHTIETHKYRLMKKIERIPGVRLMSRRGSYGIFFDDKAPD